MRVREKFAWVMLTALGLFVVAAMAGVATSGPLDPPGPVGSTMKTLEEIPGSWSRVLSTAGEDPCNTDRFRCVMNDEAVLDLETGLVWQRTVPEATVTYATAVAHCRAATTGDRRGWRLPSLVEVQSLMAMDEPNHTPLNHPFTPETWSFVVWSSTQRSSSPAWIRTVNLHSGLIGSVPKHREQRYWCVRAPEGADEALAIEPPPPSWHQLLDTFQGMVGDPCTTERFLCVFNDEAVLDRETGLVWQRAPTGDVMTWAAAFNHCVGPDARHANRRGWRLPTVYELSTLITEPSGLPDHSPFTASEWYWTSTENPSDPSGSAFAVRFSFAASQVGTFTKATERGVWCVRAPE